MFATTECPEREMACLHDARCSVFAATKMPDAASDMQQQACTG